MNVGVSLCNEEKMADSVPVDLNSKTNALINSEDKLPPSNAGAAIPSEYNSVESSFQDQIPAHRSADPNSPIGASVSLLLTSSSKNAVETGIPAKNVELVSHDESEKNSKTYHSVSVGTDEQQFCDLKEIAHLQNNQQEHPVCSKHKEMSNLYSANALPVAKPTLCKSCSKSMLSYILLMQNFLDGVAKDVSKQIDPIGQCLECVKENFILTRERQFSVPVGVGQASVNETEFVTKSSTQTEKEHVKTASSSHSEHQPKDTDIRTSDASEHLAAAESSKGGKSKPSKRKVSGRKSSITRDKQHYLSDQVGFIYSEPQATQQNEISRDTIDQLDHHLNYRDVSEFIATSQTETRTSNEPHVTHLEQKKQEYSTVTSDERQDTHAFVDQSASNENQQIEERSAVRPSNLLKDDNQSSVSHYPSAQRETFEFHHHPQSKHQGSTQQNILSDSGYFADENRVPLQPSQGPGISNVVPISQTFQGSSPTLFSFNDGVGDIMSALFEAERGAYEAARSPSDWERWTELQTKPGSLTVGQVTTEAFVTIARTNADALGCLVLGSSLLLCRTTRTLCVIVCDGVSSAFMAPLTSVFHVVQHIRSFDSLGTTKLSLLDEPDMGISFTKLNVWRLEQFKKCVYLNPDTVVVRNCDELFCHEELSAVPDIGWPDCFNSGVFVYVPSSHTFWQLLNFAEEQGSFDGGDQGLLNTYFNSWSQDIHKKLSFIYNLMANVSYTYTPAFKQFGGNVKVVQFLGPFKPWHVKFYSGTGQIAPSSAVHPTYVQFVHVWLNIFRISILPLFSQEIQKYVSSQDTISASELLIFFPSGKESEVEFLLAPPSVRIHPSNKQRRESLKHLQLPLKEQETPDSGIGTTSSSEKPSESYEDDVFAIPSRKETREESPEPEVEKTIAETQESPVSTDTSSVMIPTTADDSSLPVTESEKIPTNPLPGYEMGDYKGMMAWEQGRMDYEGSASSDNIIKRLRYLMDKPRQPE